MLRSITFPSLESRSEKNSKTRFITKALCKTHKRLANPDELGCPIGAEPEGVPGNVDGHCAQGRLGKGPVKVVGIGAVDLLPVAVVPGRILQADPGDVETGEVGDFLVL